MTILGTRPEIIRLSIIIEKLDAQCEHVLVHTGQNFTPALKDVFFDELKVRAPDHYLNARGTFGEQLAVMMPAVERLMAEEKPDRLLILGDTNSGLAAVVAKRAGISVYHMEAGNRCFDDKVPEETNRRIIDHSSDILMPYTERSRQNLLREGFEGRRIYVTGNPINEVIRRHEAAVESAGILKQLQLSPKQYMLVTVHRAENVDREDRLVKLLESLSLIEQEYRLPVIISTHPRTRQRMAQFGIKTGLKGLQFLDPFGFFDFIKLERNARCVLSDSGTVQEECCILGVPNVTLRDVTERPETIECGSNMLGGVEPGRVMRCVRAVIDKPTLWSVPAEYQRTDVSDTVGRILIA
jgi:UDP-N-acetylglucosamine 2-epimerase (non-hydrolysing)